MVIDQSTIGERMKAVRMHHGLTQKAMAEAIRTHLAYLSSLERGFCDVLPNLLVKRLCDTYGVNEEWLRSGEGTMFGAVVTDAQPMDYIDYISA